MMKVVRVKDAKIKPIKPFKTIEEEANYWDTHDVISNIDKSTAVGFHKANKTSTLTIRFDTEDEQWVRQEALKKGVGPSTLVRMWVKEIRQHGQAHHSVR